MITSLLLSLVPQVATMSMRGGAVLMMIVVAVVAFTGLALLGKLLSEAVAVVATLAAAGAKVAIVGILAVILAFALL
ncbi:MAG: hypothetical protein ACT4RN_11500 [Pseudonocardia sp.]